MKIKFVYGILPAFVFYTERVPIAVAGRANAFVVRIRPSYAGDEGILQHELTHVKQAYRLLLIGHAMLYIFSKRYRYAAEVEAYKAQLRHSVLWDSDRNRFAEFICTRYRLDVSFWETYTLLGANSWT